MDIFFWIVTISLFFLGIVGSIVPFIPGIIFIVTGCIFQTLISGKHLPLFFWVILIILTLVGLFIDKLISYYGAKQWGGTLAGCLGALIGLTLGSLFFTPLIGIFISPFTGAIGELIFSKQKLIDAGKSGLAASVGLILGTVASFFINILIIAIFFAVFFFS